MEQHCFAFHLVERYSDIAKILKEKQICVGSCGILFTPIRKWLLYKPTSNTEISALLKLEFLLEQCWGIGIRIDTLKDLFPNSYSWDNLSREKDLTFFQLTQNSVISLDTLDVKRDIIILCPTNNDCKRFIQSKIKYTESVKPKNYIKWHWMSVSHDTITRYPRTDKKLDAYLKKTFQMRNWVENEYIEETETPLF